LKCPKVTRDKSTSSFLLQIIFLEELKMWVSKRSWFGNGSFCHSGEIVAWVELLLPEKKKKKFYNWSESRKSCHILKRKSSAEISYTLHFQSFTKKKKKKKCNVSFSQGRFLSLSKLVQFFLVWLPRLIFRLSAKKAKAILCRHLSSSPLTNSSKTKIIELFNAKRWFILYTYLCTYSTANLQK
jgi:hypothetical protein